MAIEPKSTMLFAIGIVGFMLAVSQEAVGQPRPQDIDFGLLDSVRHIILNDTHLVQIGRDHYVILNPGLKESITAFSIEDNRIETRMSGQIFSGFTPMSQDVHRLAEATTVHQKLMDLSSGSSELEPNDRFVSVEYPNDGANIRVLASQNFNSLEVRGDKHATVVYDDKQFSVYDEQIRGWTHNRIFWIADTLVFTRVHPTPFVHAVHRDYLRSREKEDVDSIIAKILSKRY